MGLRYALFDLDGTLVDSLPVMVDSFNKIFGPRVGREIRREEVVASLGPRLVSICERYVGPEQAEQYLAEYLAYYRGVNDRLARIYQGIPELLEGLRCRGISMAVVTSKKRATALATLDQFGLAPYMRAVVAEDDVRALKPDPEGILAALRHLEAEPHQAVMVGDSPGDLLAARAAGVHSAAACWGFCGPDALRPCSPDYLLSEPADLLAAFSGGRRREGGQQEPIQQPPGERRESEEAS